MHIQRCVNCRGSSFSIKQNDVNQDRLIFSSFVNNHFSTEQDIHVVLFTLKLEL